MLDYKRQITRKALLEHARNMARSGNHANAESIVTALQSADGFKCVRPWFDDRLFRQQLDRLCTLAREDGTGPRSPRGGRVPT